MVYLVGAGPGDTGLITVKGKELLKIADVVVYDSLINTNLLSYCRKNTKFIFVGKKSDNKSTTQKEINKILIDSSVQNKLVVRLKGGDPFLFGRGGEEAVALTKSGVLVEIVPGVSSISAVPAYSGVPLTHRNFNSSFAVITGHENPYKPKSRINWDAISNLDTLVFLMSLSNLSLIIKKLISKKMPPDTPVLITSCGTLPTQNAVVGTLSNIVKKVAVDNTIKAPAVILVGKIVNLRKSMNWFEKKPLFGKNIIITRASDQSSGLREKLYSYGANVIELPSIKTVPVKSWKEVDKSIKNFKIYDYVIFTSVKGVNYFFERIRKNKLDSRIFNNKTIITIGEKTAKQLNKYGLSSDLTPKQYTAEGILTDLKIYDLKNKNVLIPRAKVARDILPRTLKELKADVTVVKCYETVLPRTDRNLKLNVINKLKTGEIDLITFTSSSTVTNLHKMLGEEIKHLNNTLISSIGPITTSTIKDLGFKAEILAKKHTIEGLIDEILRYYSSASKAKKTKNS